MMESNNAHGELARLIQREVDNGRSTRAIAELAQERGHKLSHSKVWQWQRGVDVKAPDREQIVALAAGLDIPPSIVQRAVFLDYFDYDPTMQGQGDAFMASLPREIRTFLMMAGAWLNNMSEADRDEVIGEFTRRAMRAR